MFLVLYSKLILVTLYILSPRGSIIHPSYSANLSPLYCSTWYQPGADLDLAAAARASARVAPWEIDLHDLRRGRATRSRVCPLIRDWFPSVAWSVLLFWFIDL